jgi:hypothetical protein
MEAYENTPDAAGLDAFRRRRSDEALKEEQAADVHVLRPGVICDTDTRGHATPRDRPLVEIVVDASEGFVPLWAPNTTLRWRFQRRSLSIFQNPTSAQRAIETLMGEALLAWGDAAPVKFAKRDDAWDFEVVVREQDRCNVNGCVLASAFFPDAGRHELVIYPKMFSQTRAEQIETLVHEFGHTFGLRHFFANVSETAWPSIIFGTHQPFTIMNYGQQSLLTDADKSDVKQLYRAAWNGTLTNINGTPVKLVKPFHTLSTARPKHLPAAVSDVQLEALLQPHGLRAIGSA